MGTCLESSSSSKKKYEFSVRFSPRLKALFDNYYQIVQYIKTSNLFSGVTPELTSAVDKYLTNIFGFDKSDMNLCAVDSAHKLHPVDYATQKVTKEWLT